jgi:coatomer subunit beta'
VDGSFELESTISDCVRTGQWVGDCFLYTNAAGKLNYFVGGQVMTLAHLDHRMYLLGYVPKEDRAFLIDKSYNVVSYKLLLSVLNYQTAVVRKDFVTANALLPAIPKSEHLSVARFLESQGFKEEALAVTPDSDHKFELAVDLRRMDVAHRVLLEYKVDDVGSTDYQSKWRRLGDLALANGDVALAQTCAEKSGDLSGLLLLYSSSGDRQGIETLALQAKEAGRSNVAFLAYFITGQVEQCIQLLLDTGRIPEAAFMARTYMPSRISSVLELWKTDLKSVNEKAAEALADPARYPNLFPDLEYALKAEELVKASSGRHAAASSYPSSRGEMEVNLIELIKEQGASAFVRSSSQENADEDEVDETPDEEAGVAEVYNYEGEDGDAAEEAAEEEAAEEEDVNVNEGVDEEDVDQSADLDVEAEEDVEEEEEEEEEAEETVAQTTAAVAKATVSSEPELEDDDDDDVDALLAGDDVAGDEDDDAGEGDDEDW